MKNKSFQIKFFLFISILTVSFCSNKTDLVKVKCDLLSSYNLRSDYNFSQYVVNNKDEYLSFLNLINKDSVYINIEKDFSPDFIKYSYVFSCKTIVSMEYNAEKEINGESECFNWYQKKYHILKFNIKPDSVQMQIKLYRIEKEKKFGFKEDCG